MSKQRLLFITTGGTIASVRTAQGLKPVLTSEELLAHLPELQQLCCPETLNLCSIDSTDLGPEHWLMMAKAVQENYALYDGFIICHGTDTLAYSAAALSYLIQNADKPIILTGAQQPISNEITDAKKNLRDSVICALDPGSRIVVDDHMQTSLPGLYAAGDCTGGLLQVAKAVYEGAVAGTEAAKALRK